MKIRDMITEGADKLAKAGIECADNDAKLLARHILNCDYTRLTLIYMDEVDIDTCKKYYQLIDKRCEHYPCQYIIGTQDFMGIEFEVSENVLIPRPETEILVETALDYAKKYQYKSLDSEACVGVTKSIRVLDMCCGSGCIGISFKLSRMNNRYLGDEVDLADISDYAISLTEKNNLKHNAHCNIIKTDLFENIHSRYDMILSNPPYIKSRDVDGLMEDVRLYEPRLALDGKEDGLYFYDRIIREAGTYLNENGIIIFEIGYDQAEDIRTLLVENAFLDVKIIKDYAGLNRIVCARRNCNEAKLHIL